MQYFRNHELAKRYNVSQTTVGKWVEAAKQGKLDLAMIEDGDKSFIAATNKNSKTIEELLENRKKYFNKLSHKVVKPRPEFYTRFSPEQVLDIVKSLQVSAELPWSYNYHGQGAAYWDKQVNIRLNEYGFLPENLLLDMIKSYVDSITRDVSKINLVDIGPGNAEPVKNFIGQLLKENKMGRYLAIDSSPEMLVLAERNLKKWFGKSFDFEGDIRDVTYERFSELIARDRDDKSLNFLLFLGGTLCNFPSPNDTLRVLYGSMGSNDFLIHSQKLDTPQNRNIFSFEKSQNIKKLASNYRLVLDMLNIDDSMFEVVMDFDEKLKRRYLGIKLNVALTIEFDIDACDLTQEVKFNKGDTILLWHYKHQNSQEVLDQFESNGFDVIHSSQTPDREFMILVATIKKDR